MRLLLAASVAMLFVACASEPQAVSVAASGDTQTAMVCSREYPVGSNIAVTKCRTSEQIAAEKAAATEGLRRTQAGGPNAKMGDGR